MCQANLPEILPKTSIHPSHRMSWTAQFRTNTPTLLHPCYSTIRPITPPPCILCLTDISLTLWVLLHLLKFGQLSHTVDSFHVPGADLSKAPTLNVSLKRNLLKQNNWHHLCGCAGPLNWLYRTVRTQKSFWFASTPLYYTYLLVSVC